MKKKFNIKGFFNKKENVAILALGLVFCVGLAVTKLTGNEIPLHDGDVLVDSAQITKEETVEEGESEEKVATDFEEKRATLDLDRNEIIAKLDETINTSKNKTEKKNALSEKEAITENMKKEVEIENIISSKSLPASFVIISSRGATVTVDEKDLSQETVTKICSIIMEETGLGADKIIIQSSY